MRTFKIAREYIEKLPDPVHTLPGFVERDPRLNVETTYESHTFFLHEERFADGSLGSAYLSVRHGGGREAWRIDWMLHRALGALIAAGKDHDAFFFCWGLIDALRAERQRAASETREEYAQAFVEGRLRKRKKRGTNVYSVRIEPDLRPAPKTAHEALARRRETPRIE